MNSDSRTPRCKINTCLHVAVVRAAGLEVGVEKLGMQARLSALSNTSDAARVRHPRRRRTEPANTRATGISRPTPIPGWRYIAGLARERPGLPWPSACIASSCMRVTEARWPFPRPSRNYQSHPGQSDKLWPQAVGPFTNRSLAPRALALVSERRETCCFGSLAKRADPLLPLDPAGGVSGLDRRMIRSRSGIGREAWLESCGLALSSRPLCLEHLAPLA